MGLITDMFVSTFRDFVTDGVPLSGKHKVRKGDARALGAVIEQQVAGAVAGMIQRESWTALVATPGTRTGQPGRVPNQAGTHVDPISGATVSNQGEYAWAGTGWRWIAAIIDDTARLDQQDITLAETKTSLVDDDDFAIRDSQAGAGANPRKRSKLSDLRRSVFKLEATSSNAIVTITDSNGRAAAEIDQGGRLALPDPTGKLRREPRTGQRNQLDATGWPTHAASIDNFPGSVVTASLTYVRKYYSETLFFFPVFGQSLAGGASDILADGAITTTTPYGAQALMPSVGRKPRGVTFDTFVPSFEWTGTESSKSTETINSPMLNQMIATLFARTGVAPTMAAAAFSEGSRAWPQLGPGNDAWAHFMKGLRNAVQAAHNRGRLLEVPAIVILWGEQNRVSGLNSGTLRSHYLNMARQIKAAVREIVGQDFDPVIFISVPANSVVTPDRDFPHMTVPASLHGVEGIRVLNPNYVYPVAQNIHPTAEGYNRMGKDIARAILQECFGPGYAPLRFIPERMRWTSATQFILPCDVSSPPIVIDTSGTVVTVPSWGNAGFQLFDRDGEITINTVEAWVDDGLEFNPVKDLRFTLARTPVGAPRISYAMHNDGTGKNGGPENGARGLIRDSGADFQKWALPMFAHLPAA